MIKSFYMTICKELSEPIPHGVDTMSIFGTFLVQSANQIGMAGGWVDEWHFSSTATEAGIVGLFCTYKVFGDQALVVSQLKVLEGRAKQLSLNEITREEMFSEIVFDTTSGEL